MLGPLALTACVGTHDDLGLDDLPPYDQDTGGGKGDDPNCTDESYRAFIPGYLRDEVKADANPCAWGNDASYRIWAYVAGEQLKPMLEAYRAASNKRASARGTRDEVIAAATLSDETKVMLQKLEQIKPAHAGKVGVAAWLEFLYKPTLEQASGIVSSLDTSVIITEGVDQMKHEITPFEDEWLGFAERAQPTATEEHSFTLWWQLVGPKLSDPLGPLSTTIFDAKQKAIDATYVTRLASIRPAGPFDADGQTFHADVTAKIAADYGFSGNPDRFAGMVPMRPTGGGPLSYAAWAQPFVAVAQKYSAGTPSEVEKRSFQLIIDARPCGSGPEVDAIVQRLKTGLATAGNAPNGTPLAVVAVPTACKL
jgi:hypothetical protein